WGGVGSWASPSVSETDPQVGTLSANGFCRTNAGGTAVDCNVAAATQLSNIGAAPAAGSSSITTLGTVATGTWNATTIAINKGGTGQVTQQTAINALAGATTSGNYLRGNGTNVLMAAIPSSDITTSLGYTPANRAGDTMTGSLTLSSGSLSVSNGNVTADNLYTEWHSWSDGCPGGWACGGFFSSIVVDGVYYTSLQQRSDQRLKKDIVSLAEGDVVDRLLSLRPVSYHWISKSEDPTVQYGFIAQEVEEVMPELVKRADDPMKTYSVNYINLLSPMVLAIKKLFNIQTEAAEKLKTLEEKIEVLEQQNSELKQLVCLSHPTAEACKRAPASESE
ncbi:MAG: tail fiber domain-containing protein, partial [Pseudobdellovibrionaceae bacterium]